MSYGTSTRSVGSLSAIAVAARCTASRTSRPSTWHVEPSESDTTAVRRPCGQVSLRIRSGIGSRPSCGKTTLLLNILNALYSELYSKPFRCLAAWTERGARMQFWSWAALRYGLDEDAVLRGDWGAVGGTEVGRQIWTEVMLLRSHDEVRFMDSVNRTVRQLMAAVDEYRPDVLLLDYLQRIRPERKQTKWEALSEMAVMLRETAVSRDMIVIAGSQLKRQGDRVFDKYRPPDLEGFKGAGEIEESAEIALGDYRPLKPMTRNQERSVREGHEGIERWQYPNTMTIKELKRT